MFIDQVSRYEKHIIKERLKAMKLPTTDQRVSFIWWLEHKAHHIFSIDEYSALFDAGNAYRNIYQYEDAGYLTRVSYNGVTYFITSFMSTHPHYKCKCCNNINTEKLLQAKQEYLNNDDSN